MIERVSVGCLDHQLREKLGYWGLNSCRLVSFFHILHDLCSWVTDALHRGMIYQPRRGIGAHMRVIPAHISRCRCVHHNSAYLHEIIPITEG